MAVKTYTAKFKKGLRDWIVALGILVLVLLLLQLDFVAELVAKIFNTTPQTVKATAQSLVPVVIGLVLIGAGAALAAIPVVAVVLVVAGLAVLGYAAWIYFSASGE